MKKLILLLAPMLLFSPIKSFASLLLLGPCNPMATSCQYYSYSDWGICSADGVMTRTVINRIPEGCCGGIEAITSSSCSYITPTPSCTERLYTPWDNQCLNGQQSRGFTGYYPTGCIGGVTESEAVLTQSCIACTSYIYSNWSECVDGKQERLILYKTPSGCVGEPNTSVVLSQNCGQENNIVPPDPTNNDSFGVTDINSQDAVIREKMLISKIDNNLVKRLSGKILLQVEENGEAWYVNPTDSMKYYLQNGEIAYEALKKFGAGISNVDIAKIPVGVEKRFSDVDTDGDGLADQLEEGLKTDPNKIDTDGDGVSDGKEVLENNTNPLGTGYLNYSGSLVNRFKGRILLQVESHGEAWYVNPDDGKRYYMKNGEAAYQIMRFLSLGITNDNLRKIGIGDL